MALLKLDNNKNQRLSFLCEWYIEEGDFTRKLLLVFHLRDNSVEVFDDQRKLFLRRTEMQHIKQTDLFIGSKIDVLGRQFDIVDYGNEFTKQALSKLRKSAFILVTGKALPLFGAILSAFISENFFMNRAMMARFSNRQIRSFVGDTFDDKAKSTQFLHYLAAGPSIGMEMVTENAFRKVLYCYRQAKDEEIPQFEIPEEIYELFTKPGIHESIYCSQTEDNLTNDIKYFFDPNSKLQANVRMENTTLGIVKPHAIKEGNLGIILNLILTNGFEICALRTRIMERVNCKEFYEVYRGVVHEYPNMVTQLASGICLVMEVACLDKTKNSYAEFRKFCGPSNPLTAQELRPNTLRALFGQNKAMNAIHCTDLENDTLIELHYMFKLLE